MVASNAEIINGKGKEYNYKNQLIYYGEYLDGKRWNGKVEYNFLNPYKLIIEDELINGEKFIL